jgi:hypothetical protein
MKRRAEGVRGERMEVVRGRRCAGGEEVGGVELCERAVVAVRSDVLCG